MHLVRVEEVQRPTTARATASDMIDPSKPVALYNVRKQLYVAPNDRYGGETYSMVDKARVFPNLAATLEFNFPYIAVGLKEEFAIHQVETYTPDPIITETVLK
jgi:hypothetical protein